MSIMSVSGGYRKARNSPPHSFAQGEAMKSVKAWAIFHDERILMGTIRDTKSAAVASMTGPSTTWVSLKSIGFTCRRVTVKEE
jgi:hypothetical protein